MQEIEHFTPETLDEAAALLMAAHGSVPPLVEGTRHTIQVTDGPRPCTLVVDLSRVPELNRLDYDERVGLRIGAAVSYASLLEFPPVPRVYPILADACSGNRPGDAGQRSTLGVILRDAQASADLAPSLICLRASAAIFGPHGWSELDIEALPAGSGKARVQPGEFVVDVRLSPPPTRSGGAYLRSRPQETVGQSAAGFGAFLVMEEDLVTCCGARLVLRAAAGLAVRSMEAERFLAGKRLEEAVVHEAAALAARKARREGDGGGSTVDHLDTTDELARRAILEALTRARRAAI